MRHRQTIPLDYQKLDDTVLDNGAAAKRRHYHIECDEPGCVASPKAANDLPAHHT
jgi:hypothetical protein